MRKRLETNELAEHIRVYARAYDNEGQEERAEGMRQAAGIVEELMSKKAYPLPVEMSAAAEALGKFGERLSIIEKQVNVLLRSYSGRKLPKPKEPKEPKIQSIISESLRRRVPAIVANRKSGETGRAALTKGEHKILSVLVGEKPRSFTSDELMAITAYKETSLRTYLDNLRAGGLVESDRSIHGPTDAGIERLNVENEGGVTLDPLTGKELLDYWLDEASSLSKGERVILKAVAESQNKADEDRGLDFGIAMRDLGLATSYAETSVRTYVDALVRRKLITRKAGVVRLVPILKQAKD